MKMKLSCIGIMLLFHLLVCGQSELTKFFDDADRFFATYVVEGNVDYGALSKDNALAELMVIVEDMDLDAMDSVSKKAFLINAYNLAVIREVLKIYPTHSVLKKTNFFEGKVLRIGDEELSLNRLEKELLLGQFEDARLHFVLVCAARSCPEIANFAYLPTELDRQIESQTRKSLRSKEVLVIKNESIDVSQIFDWYKPEFGGSDAAIIEFINQYLETPVQKHGKLNFLSYNWQLNDVAGKDAGSDMGTRPVDSRYVVSAAIPKGRWEMKFFNNLYSQKREAQPGFFLRDGFFTQTLSLLYGVTGRFNAGMIARNRRTKTHSGNSSPFNVLTGGSDGVSRSRLTGIGPMIRFAPFKNLKKFSIQSSLLIPTGSNLEGEDGSIYIDWSAPTFQTQIFNDFTINSHLTLFTELDFLIEDIGSLSRFSTPATLILSYFPVTNVTLYGLGSYSPFWQSDYDYFYQLGIGAKYQFTPAFELELLWTDFRNSFLSESNGSAKTYNLGLRFNL